MDYGCDVSNRYTGYLDSSDHGNTTSTSIRKKKSKAKKKRKSPNKNLSENSVENIEITNSNPLTEVYENHQICSNDNKCDTSYKQENVPHETNSTCPKSSTSCGSAIQSEMSREEVKMSDESLVQKTTTAPDGINVNETKWSEICFEEEKNLITLKSQSNTDAETQQTHNVPECIQDVFNEHRIYPTIYFYNSNFGNRNRRFIEWHDFGRRSNNESEFHNRNKNYFTSDHGNNGNNNNNNGFRDDERKKKRQKRNRRRMINTSIEGDSHDVSGETRSNDEQPAKDSQNESTEQISIAEDVKNTEHTNESNQHEINKSKNRYNRLKHGLNRRKFNQIRSNVKQPAKDSQNESNEQAPIAQDVNNTEHTNESNQRELNNSKNRYNRLKHGLPPRTFNRRRSDFVRNV